MYDAFLLTEIWEISHKSCLDVNLKPFEVVCYTYELLV